MHVEIPPGDGPGLRDVSSLSSGDDDWLTAYYAHFHPGHSVMLPKLHFMRHLRQYPDSDSMTFLLSVVKYIGSRYTPGGNLEGLREAAFAGACGPLPMTPQSVLGLLLLSVAALGEMELESQKGWTNRAINVALGIGMQRKEFADNTPDPVLAECYRRVFWGLYLVDCIRHIRDPTEKISLRELIGDVDLPCEEWEYDAGQIPQSTSLAEYDQQNTLGSAEFSSWTYLVDMARIASKLVLPYHGNPDEKQLGLFERADSLICDWLIKLPQWKMDLVDSNGVADMILFHAITYAQQNRLLLRQCAARRGLDLRKTFSLGPARGPHKHAQKVKSFGWNAIPIEVQAADSVCRLFQKPFPPTNLSPLCVPGMIWVAVAYLDACVFLGLDTPEYREKLNILLHILTVHGELWPLSRKIAEEVREVAENYSILGPTPARDLAVNPVSRAPTSIPVGDDIAQTVSLDLNFPMFQDVFGVDYWTDESNISSM